MRTDPAVFGGQILCEPVFWPLGEICLKLEPLKMPELLKHLQK